MKTVLQDCTLLQGDCLELMHDIPDQSIDMVLTDLPYGTTACKWDSIIPLDQMWQHLKRIIKPNGAIVMTASQPFTTKLIASNYEMFKYCWVWHKPIGTNFFNAKHQPLKVHEDIIIFSKSASSHSKKGSMVYNPQKTKGKPYKCVQGDGQHKYHQEMGGNISQSNKRFPKSIQKFNIERGLHPTQKPVALMQYLIKTYTNKGDTVLDFTMGSGTTGVACVKEKRKFIGIELDEGYYKIAVHRVREEQKQGVLGL